MAYAYIIRVFFMGLVVNKLCKRKVSKIVNINKTHDSLLNVLQVQLLSFFILKMESKT